MENNWISQIHLHRKQYFSQTGEEGFIEFILDNIGHGKKHLVDIGAGDGQYLSNTKYFIEEHGYKNILLDGDSRGNAKVKEFWITKDNVCDLLMRYKCPKEFTLLSIDLDGNDYDIIESICEVFRPRLIVCEINGTIPQGVSKKIAYNETHVWNNNDYYGFSFSAGLKLASKIGYRAVFQNDALNMYLVREDLLPEGIGEIDLAFNHSQYHPHEPNGVWEVVK
jgi:hypothetical protein